MTAPASSPAPLARKESPSSVAPIGIRHESNVSAKGALRKCGLVSRHERSEGDERSGDECLFQEIAREFRENRKTAKITQKKVAEEWLVERRTVINWEQTGKIPTAVFRWVERAAIESLRRTGTNG